MYENNLNNDLEYRKEIVSSLFNRISAVESCVIVGAASMGKSRLLKYILRQDVQHKYLGEEASNTLLISVDSNNLAPTAEKPSSGFSAWKIYELLLTSIIESSRQHPLAKKHYRILNDLREPVILEKDALLGLRHLSLSIKLLVEEHDLRLCFLLDEFDNLYQSLPSITLSNLRALRDSNKMNMCYVLFMRETPENVRDPGECESFYELFSHFVFGLKPYTMPDAKRMIETLEERRREKLSPDVKKALLYLSGRHPGMMMSLFRIASDEPQLFLKQAGIKSLVEKPIVIEECGKLKDSLSNLEQQAYLDILHGKTVSENLRKQIHVKGLIKNEHSETASSIPIFAYYMKADL
jgi:hypothetical protein